MLARLCDMRRPAVSRYPVDRQRLALILPHRVWIPFDNLWDAHGWAWEQFGPSRTALCVDPAGSVEPLHGMWDVVTMTFYFADPDAALEFKMRWR